jgi:hypothetical protein
MSSYGATRGLSNRPGRFAASSVTLVKAGTLLVAFFLGGVIALFLETKVPTRPPLPAAEEAFGPIARERVMLGQITSLQRQLSLRDSELVKLRSPPLDEVRPLPATDVARVPTAPQHDVGIVKSIGSSRAPLVWLYHLAVKKTMLTCSLVHWVRWL